MKQLTTLFVLICFWGCEEEPNCHELNSKHQISVNNEFQLNVEIEYEILRNEINQTANFPAKYECVQETIVSTHEVPNLSETILKMEAEEVNTLLGVYYYAGVPADGRTPLFVLDEARKATSIIIKSNGTVIAAN